MGPLHHPKRRLSVAHDMIGSRRRIVYCKQARQPDSRQSGNKFYKAYKRNKLLRAFSLLKDTQPELRISSKITVQRVFNLPGFPHNQTRTIFSSHCRAMGRTQLLMLWRVDMPLKPSANSDTRRDATNLNTRRTRTPGPTAINLNRAKYPPPLRGGFND